MRSAAGFLVSVILAFAACAFAAPILTQPNDAAKTWALLVAGSDTYMNYRHQADVSHSYHVLVSRGVPPSQIIVMMYDDIVEPPTPSLPSSYSTNI